MHGEGTIPGDILDQCSYRTEIIRQLGSMVSLDSLHLPRNYPQTKHHITTICDIFSALNIVGIDSSFIKLSKKHVHPYFHSMESLLL